MAPRKPAPDTGVTDELPAFFKDALEGGVSPTRAEVWRLQPNGPAYVGEPPLDATAADLIDFVRGEDKAHGRTGGVYQAKLKDAQGKIITNVRFRVDRDGELKAAREDDAGGGKGDPMMAGVGTLVTMLEQQARSYEARVRADMSSREQQARLDADRRRAEADQERQREREFWGQQRERDRELSDQARERDRAMYTFLLQAKGGESGGGKEVIASLMAGIELARAFSEDGGGRGGGDSFGDKIIGRLADGFSRKFGGDDAVPTTATTSASARPAPKREAPVDKRGARGKAAEDDDEPSDAEKMADMLELLVLNTDEHAASTVIESLIKNGKLPRALVGQLAKGKLDEELEWDKDALDKVRKAAETAYRATAPRPVPAQQ